MKKSKQIKRKLSFKKLTIAILNQDSKIKIKGGGVSAATSAPLDGDDSLNCIGTGSVVDTSQTANTCRYCPEEY